MEGVAGATSKELRVSDGRETVSAPEDSEPRWNRGERQRGETPMEVFPKGISSLSTAKNLRSFPKFPSVSFG